MGACFKPYIAHFKRQTWLGNWGLVKPGSCSIKIVSSRKRLRKAFLTSSCHRDQLFMTTTEKNNILVVGLITGGQVSSKSTSKTWLALYN